MGAAQGNLPQISAQKIGMSSLASGLNVPSYFEVDSDRAPNADSQQIRLKRNK